jgi:hypothetical protein
MYNCEFLEMLRHLEAFIVREVFKIKNLYVITLFMDYISYGVLTQTSLGSVIADTGNNSTRSPCSSIIMKVYCICVFYAPQLSDTISGVRACVNCMCKYSTFPWKGLMGTYSISMRNRNTAVNENHEKNNISGTAPTMQICKLTVRSVDILEIKVSNEQIADHTGCAV